MFKRNNLFFASSISLFISMICFLKAISLDAKSFKGITLINAIQTSDSFKFYITTLILCLLFSVLCFLKGKTYNPLSKKKPNKISKYTL